MFIVCNRSNSLNFFFFLQAEDGIRDPLVTGVQTCALPITGDLAIRGQTREVTFDVTFNGLGTNPLGQAVAGFTAVTQLNRKDFGLNWNMALEAGGFLVGDTAALEIELEAVREDPAPAADAR